jgi:hypothetical protein
VVVSGSVGARSSATGTVTVGGNVIVVVVVVAETSAKDGLLAVERRTTPIHAAIPTTAGIANAATLVCRCTPSGYGAVGVDQVRATSVTP